MENLIKALVAVKVLGAALFLLMLGVFVVSMVITGSDDPEDQHGYTAVCKDGTVLEPPWNQCGEQHGYLDHWTTAP